jgi:hypothetical protein
MSKEVSVPEKTSKEVVREFFARGAPDIAIAALHHAGKKHGLDPMLKQIWLVQYDGHTWSLGVSHHGQRILAQRHPEYMGVRNIRATVKDRKTGVVERITPDLFDPAIHELQAVTGYWMFKVPDMFDERGMPVINEHRSDEEYALFREYAVYKKSGELSTQWKKRPFHMLEKCFLTKYYRNLDPDTFGAIVSEAEYDSETTVILTANDTSGGKPPTQTGEITPTPKREKKPRKPSKKKTQEVLETYKGLMWKKLSEWGIEADGLEIVRQHIIDNFQAEAVMDIEPEHLDDFKAFVDHGMEALLINEKKLSRVGVPDEELSPSS